MLNCRFFELKLKRFSNYAKDISENLELFQLISLIYELHVARESSQNTLVQELRSKRGDRYLFKMGLFSRGYGIYFRIPIIIIKINHLSIETTLHCPLYTMLTLTINNYY